MKRLSFHEQIRKNKIKSVILIIIIFLGFIALGFIISLALDPSLFFIIMIISTIFSLGYILLSYKNSHKIALASVRAKAASKEKYPQFHHSAESMALASGLPIPKLYVMESNQINAFASGKDPQHAVICMTTGSLERLNKQELEGIIAHEMSHIANYDIRFMTLVTVLVGMISIAAQIYLRSLWFSSGRRDDKNGAILMIIAILAAILAPLIANLISLSISRKREFTADATAVKFTRFPSGLKSALEKIKHEHITEKDKHHYPKAAASLFISDPFKKKFQNLFSTHPDLDTRIKRLKQM